MDKKILYIGLASLFLILLSTLSLIILVFKPSFFPLQDKKLDSLKLKEGGFINPLFGDSTKMSPDSLNYSINSLILKRENLMLIDSTYRLNNVIYYYLKVKDSLNTEVKRISNDFNSINAKYLDVLKKQTIQPVKVETKLQPFFSDQEKKGFAKIYENMTPEYAAKQMEEMPEVQVAKILLSIDSKQGAKILDKIEPKKAAKIWNALNSKGIK
jgi:flagellar motility protein MotE (MotC chaperone)